MRRRLQEGHRAKTLPLAMSPSHHTRFFALDDGFEISLELPAIIHVFSCEVAGPAFFRNGVELPEALAAVMVTVDCVPGGLADALGRHKPLGSGAEHSKTFEIRTPLIWLVTANNNCLA